MGGVDLAQLVAALGEPDRLPRLRSFPIPAIVRRKALALKMSAASTIACSSPESLRRMGLEAGASGVSLREPRNESRVLRPRSTGTTGVVGLPSLSQPYSTATSWQSGHTST